MNITHVICREPVAGESMNGTPSELSSLRGSPFQKGAIPAPVHRLTSCDGPECDPETWAQLMCDIERGDVDGVRKAIKTGTMDINQTDEVNTNVSFLLGSYWFS